MAHHFGHYVRQLFPINRRIFRDDPVSFYSAAFSAAIAIAKYVLITVIVAVVTVAAWTAPGT